MYVNRILKWLAALALLMGLLGPAFAQDPLPQAARVAVRSMNSVIGGRTIAILERNDGDLSAFYYGAMQTLCSSAPDYNWCDTDLTTSLPDTTNQLGWARILSYTSTSDGSQKQVCVILPPSPTLSATSVASGISGGQVFDWRDLATRDEALAWMWLHYGGICESGINEGALAQKRADAFASLALTLIEGSSAFVAAQDVSPSRKFSFYDGLPSTVWAANTGERVLLELWKSQAAALLKAGGCTATAVSSTNYDTPSIQRDTLLPAGQDCNPDASGNRKGSVTDANLWLWTANGGTITATWPTVPMPPKPYTPWQSFSSASEGLKYAWNTAMEIARQY